MPRWTVRRALAALVLALAAALCLLVLLHAGAYPAGVARAPIPRERGPAGEPPPRPDRGEDALTVVVMLFDGLASSMVDAVPTPALDRLRAEGAWTHRLVPAFPSVSLVNGFTITTGCFPARHGVVNNRFLDPRRGLFDHGRDADWILGCEPLHVVAERQGVPVASLGWYADRSSSRGWLVSRADSPWTGPDYPQDAERAAEIVELLALPAERRPGLILAYLRGPDDVAHDAGLDAPRTRAAVAGADAAVALVVAAIEAGGRRDRIALVVTTDHGMLPAHRLVNLERILLHEGIRGTMLASGSVGFVYLDDPSEAAGALRRLSRYDEFDVFSRDAQPPWARLGTSPRVGDLIVSAHPPYFIEDRGVWPRWARWLARWGPRFADAGPLLRATHGYPPDTPGVQGVLYAWGAGVPRGVDLGRVEAVDIHPMVTHLLSIPPGHPLDGDGDVFRRAATEAFSERGFRGHLQAQPTSRQGLPAGGVRKVSPKPP